MRFEVQDSPDAVDLRMRSQDGEVVVAVRGRYGGALPMRDLAAESHPR